MSEMNNRLIRQLTGCQHVSTQAEGRIYEQKSLWHYTTVCGAILLCIKFAPFLEDEYELHAATAKFRKKTFQRNLSVSSALHFAVISFIMQKTLQND